MDALSLLAYLLSGMNAILLYIYFCKLSGSVCRWYGIAIYAALSYGLAVLEYLHWIGPFLYVLPGILLLTVCGVFLQKCRFTESLVLSALVISVHSVVAGIAQSLTFWVVASINYVAILRFADIFQNIAALALLLFVFHRIHTSFAGSLRSVRLPYRLMLLIPILFITLVGAFLSDTVYGNTIIVDSELGLIFPQVDNAALLSLRLLACVCLFSTLYAYKRLGRAVEQEKTMQLLEGQAKNQEIYIKEAKERYEQTSSFRHDIKNHLLVVRQLLLDNNPVAAQAYLEGLDEVADTLSFPVQTGNDGVDALLSSKLAVAAAKGICVDCAVQIPKQSGVSDIDWCIVLSNALDNAINASEALGEQEKRISISGNQKGNFYLLHIENRCHADTKPPKAGIGLSNISAVLNKYNGRLDIEVSGGVFKLNALFVIPQHSESISQQTS